MLPVISRAPGGPSAGAPGQNPQLWGTQGNEAIPPGQAGDLAGADLRSCQHPASRWFTGGRAPTRARGRLQASLRPVFTDGVEARPRAVCVVSPVYVWTSVCGGVAQHSPAAALWESPGPQGGAHQTGAAVSPAARREGLGPGPWKGVSWCRCPPPSVDQGGPRGPEGSAVWVEPPVLMGALPQALSKVRRGPALEEVPALVTSPGFTKEANCLATMGPQLTRPWEAQGIQQRGQPGKAQATGSWHSHGWLAPQTALPSSPGYCGHVTPHGKETLLT